MCVPQIHTKIKVFWFFFTALIWKQILKTIDFSIWGFPKLHFLENSKAMCIWTLFLICTIALDDIWDAFLYSDMKGYILPNFFPFVFCISDTTLLLFRFHERKKSLFKLYSLDVYLSEFFKLSLVGLWLGEEDEWPKRYSCLESMVGFFGISVKNKKNLI